MAHALLSDHKLGGACCFRVERGAGANHTSMAGSIARREGTFGDCVSSRKTAGPSKPLPAAAKHLPHHLCRPMQDAPTSCRPSLFPRDEKHVYEYLVDASPSHRAKLLCAATATPEGHHGQPLAWHSYSPFSLAILRCYGWSTLQHARTAHVDCRIGRVTRWL